MGMGSPLLQLAQLDRSDLIEKLILLGADVEQTTAELPFDLNSHETFHHAAPGHEDGDHDDWFSGSVLEWAGCPKRADVVGFLNGVERTVRG